MNRETYRVVSYIIIFLKTAVVLFLTAGTKVDVVASDAACGVYSILYVLQLQAGEEDTAGFVQQ